MPRNYHSPDKGLRVEMDRDVLIARLTAAASHYREKYETFKARYIADVIKQDQQRAERIATVRAQYEAEKAIYVAERLKIPVLIPGSHKWMQPTPRNRTQEEAEEGWDKEWDNRCSKKYHKGYYGDHSHMIFGWQPRDPERTFDYYFGSQHRYLDSAARCEDLLKMVSDEDLLTISLHEDDLRLLTDLNRDEDV